MVEVTTAVPSLARVIVGRQADTLLLCPRCGLAAIIVGTDVGREHLIIHAFVGFLGIIHPRASTAEIIAMIDDDIGYDARALRLEGGNHGAKLLLRAEAAVMVEIIDGHVAHDVVGIVAIARLRHPHEAEALAELVGLPLQIFPLRIGVTVPIESLKHHAFILRGPALGVNAGHPALRGKKEEKGGEKGTSHTRFVSFMVRQALGRTALPKAA